jgi:hypothetical protein
MTAARRVGRLTAAAFLAGTTLLAQDVTLRYQWTKGESIKYRMTNESTVNLTGLPGIGEMTTSTAIVQVQTLTADAIAADGAATILTKIDSMKMDVVNPMLTISYDSANPPAPGTNPMAEQIGSAMKAVVGQTLTMVMEPTGAIRSLQGAAKMMEGASAGGLGAMGGLNLSDDALKGTMGQTFATFPGRAVKVGDTWQAEVKAPNPMGTMTISGTFTLKGLEGNVARIGYAQVIKTEVTSAPAPMSVTMAEGKGEGEMTFDRAAGRILKTTGTMTMPMTMSMTGPDGTAVTMQGMTNTKVSLELLPR